MALDDAKRATLYRSLSHRVNVYVAAGHNMLGMSMATGTGQMIAQMIDEQVPSVDPSAYRLQS